MRSPRNPLFRTCTLLFLLWASCVPALYSSPRQEAARAHSDTSSNLIRLDTVGYLPRRPKLASVAAVFTEFSVVSEPDGQTVLRGRASAGRLNDDTGETLYVADFSALRRPGLYRLDVPGVGRSAPFRVGLDVYAPAFRSAMRAMYLWRCGTAVRATHDDGTVFEHAACHLNDARLDFVGGGHVRREAVGGWHDAGDYNKYVVNAGVTVGIMLRAWEEFGPAIRRARLDAPPNDTHLPAYLREFKWETDWLLKMQAADGSVNHKVSTKDFGPMIVPEEEQTERYFTDTSTAATADFAAMLAGAARAFRPYDAAYARRCLEAARRAHTYLRANPQSRRADLKGFTTGAYQTNDDDDRLWAAAELWETTGEAIYLTDFERRARAYATKFELDWGWGNVRNLGLLTYLFSSRGGRDEQLVRQIRADLVSAADQLVRLRDAHGYARPLGKKYYWGANGGVANTTVLLRAAHRIRPRPEYVEAALDAIHHLFGRNYYARSFVTGTGANPAARPHDRRSMARPGAPAWPGYLVGGGWPKATDWVDDADNYRVNEIAINWNAPLIYALASFLEDAPAPR